MHHLFSSVSLSIFIFIFSHISQVMANGFVEFTHFNIDRNGQALESISDNVDEVNVLKVNIKKYQ